MTDHAGPPALPLLDRLFEDNGAPGPWAEMTPRAWADAEMLLRYAASLAPDDETGGLTQRIHGLLCEEHIRLVGAVRRSSGFHGLFPEDQGLGDGLGWDYDAGGSYNARMVTFKAVLIGASRALRVIPAGDRSQGGAATAAVAALVRAAFAERAALRPRRAKLDAKAVIQAANAGDLGRLGLLVSAAAPSADRWVSWNTHAFLAWHRVNPRWAWDASGAAAAVGGAE